MREPQCFSTWLSVPGFAWLDRTDSKQASACWSVSVGGLPLEPYPRIYDPVKGPMQRSLTLTPTPAATLSVLPSGSHSALRAKRQRSLTLTPTPVATLGDLSQRACELRKVPFESSPALAGMELTVSSLPCKSPCGSLGRMASTVALQCVAVYCAIWHAAEWSTADATSCAAGQ